MMQGSHRSAVLACALVVGCFEESGDVDDSGATTGCPDGACPTTTSGSDTSSTTGGTTTTSSDSGPADTSSGSTSASEPTSTGSSTTATVFCGDGMVNQPDEMCDGTPGCADDCTFEDYNCNPLTNAGCTEGLRCGVADYDLETVNCMPPGESLLGEACSGVPSNDSDCDDGLTCVFNFATNYCDSGNCCVEFCDLTDPNFMCTNGATCMQFWPTPMYQGLEHLGLCRT